MAYLPEQLEMLLAEEKAKVSELEAEVTRLKAELWVANDRPLRGYDGLADENKKLSQCNAELERKLAIVTDLEQKYTGYWHDSETLRVAAENRLQQVQFAYYNLVSIHAKVNERVCEMESENARLNTVIKEAGRAASGHGACLYCGHKWTRGNENRTCADCESKILAPGFESRQIVENSEDRSSRESAKAPLHESVGSSLNSTTAQDDAGECDAHGSTVINGECGFCPPNRTSVWTKESTQADAEREACELEFARILKETPQACPAHKLHDWYADGKVLRCRDCTEVTWNKENTSNETKGTE